MEVSCESRPFTGQDLARLVVHRSRLPGAGEATPLLVVSRSGVDAGVAGVSALGPDDLIAAWRTGTDPHGTSGP